MVDALDISSQMLIIAKEKSHNEGLHINFTMQNMCTFKSHHKYSCITCINDGVNYLASLNSVEAFLNNCNNYLLDDSILIFDISSKYKLKNMDKEFFVEELDDLAYIWSNNYDNKTSLLTMDLSFFCHVEGDMYQKTSETHIQRAHSVDEISSILKKCGFALLGVYDNISLDRYNDTSTRIHFLAKKISK